MSRAASTNGRPPDAQSSRASVLVTGAAGFIGSHLCDRLLEDGYQVWGLDNFDDSYDPAQKRENLTDALDHPSMHLVEGDVRDRVLLDGLMADVEFDIVVHLAARFGDQSSVGNPLPIYEVNVAGTLALLDAMRRHSVATLVFASSASVYGQSTASPRREDASADRPLTLYAASKRAGEMLCYTYHHQQSLTVHCLRLSSVFGPRQRPDSTFHELTKHLEYGEERTSAHQPAEDDPESRDYIYVDDAVQGIALSIERARGRDGRNSEYQVINLGGSVAVSQHELAEKLSEAMDPFLETGVQTVSQEANSEENRDPPNSSSKKAADLLGYRPSVNLDDGLAELTRWLRENRSRREQIQELKSVLRPKED